MTLPTIWVTPRLSSTSYGVITITRVGRFLFARRIKLTHGRRDRVFPGNAKSSGRGMLFWIAKQAHIQNPQETLQVNFEQHHVFHIQLEVTWLYIRKVRSNLKAKPPTSVPEPSAEIKTYDIKALSGLDPDLPFDSTAFKSYMATWIPSMVVHLRDEIATLSSELMEKAGKEKLAEIDKKLMNHLMAYDPAWFLCSAFGM